ncbi:ankyrin repeat plant-like protein, partial [Trifolium medium]|nr:ankyrin repeat plant-like protein [Trifolium medium]
MNYELENHVGSTEIPTNVELEKDWKKVLLEQVWNYMTYKDKDKWLKDMKGNLSLVATVIATMTFQMALNPPGGVRPVKDDGDNYPDDIA